MNSAERPLPEPNDALFASILTEPGRDRCPFARPVISFAENDEDAYLKAIEAAALRTVTLERRGVYHGEWAELDEERLPTELRALHAAETDGARAAAILADRWHSARPIILQGIALDLLEQFRSEIERADALHSELAQTGGLRRFLESHRADLEPAFAVLGKRASLVDRERDIERVFVESFAPNGGGRKIEDLWLKSSSLSTHPDDASLRLRVSFGSERDDDASRDILRQRLTAQLATTLLPESALISEHPILVPLVERLCGERVLFTQHIAYWNAPNGGALFHHDAFAEDELDDGAWRQLGVCYMQLSGATAWLALSTQDLVERVREFAASLEDGLMPWVRAQLFEGPRAAIPRGWPQFRALVDDDERLIRELALPGQGGLGPLLNRGPEFTAFLADAGHATVLSPGDAILLPNRSLHSTCMHSVFTASEETGYSLSLALRPDREAPEEGEPRARRSTSRRTRD